MATAPVEWFCEGHRGTTDPNAPPTKTPLDDAASGEPLHFILLDLARRCDGFCRKREDRCADSTPTSCLVGLYVSPIAHHDHDCVAVRTNDPDSVETCNRLESCVGR